MKFELIILLFFLLTFDSWAQRCGGELYFRIYDKKENKIYPSTVDTLKMNIDVNAIDIGVGRYIDGKKLPETKLSIKTIKTDGNAGTASLNLIKFPFTNLLVRFSTGCFTQLKKISLAKGKEKMILNFVDIPREVTILMDSIPFVEGEVTYNIEKIIRKNRVCEYENVPGNKFYLHYRIPYNLIKMDLPLPSTDIKEIKADTMYYYADSLKTHVISKGKVKVQKTAIIYYHSTREIMNTGVKRKEKRKSVTYLKKGTWTYNFEYYSLHRKENEKRKRKQIIDRRRLR